jgi:hypothetical protein
MLDTEKMINEETGNKLVEIEPGILVELDENDEIVATYSEPKAINKVASDDGYKNDGYEWDNDRKCYYNPDDYGGFPSHW